MANTLTEIGIKKISERFAESIDHVAYTVDEIPKTIEPFRRHDLGNRGECAACGQGERRGCKEQPILYKIVD